MVQNGEYWLLNKGDLAMLEVTLARLRRRWPAARIGVLTSTPALLRALHPDVEAIVPGRLARRTGNGPIGRIAARLSPSVVGPFSIGFISAREVPRMWTRRALRYASKRFRDVTPHAVENAEPARACDSSRAERRALRGADLLLAVGGGYLTDVDAEQAARTFRFLEQAVISGSPAALVGQGFGPLRDERLREAAAAVLPRTTLIALREGRRGPSLLAELGVASDQVIVTGDDAIELATGARRAEIGQDLGVCLRVAGYSPVATRAKAAVGSVVRTTATERGAALVPLIISEYRSEDRRSTLPLTTGFADVVPPLPRFAGPREVAARVSRCRVVVTGAYHLAVFALSQGIPVVGLTSSAYYDDKLLGLAEMFGDGLSIVRLDEPDLQSRLSSAVADAWEKAPALREPLRIRADEQVARSRDAFEQVFAAVERDLADPSILT
ncbi:polysaccharide pyruvyl transferase family protein [Pseudonocardia halophobica]|uniref:polysaccharide pyruvyl transferase family protein n=1 Tax=Pseudonocardia halophobica TaxID=29401 RepID=UPI003D8D5E76